MMEREPNIRSVRTKAALRASLAAIIREKGISAITVRELTERAGINRATFYIHYHDIKDFLKYTHDEIIGDFSAVLTLHNTASCAQNPYRMLCDMFRFLEKYSDICSALLCKNGDPEFIESIKKAVHDKTVLDWSMLRPESASSPLHAYFATFVVSGCVALFDQWYLSGMKESAEEMASLADAFIRTGSYSLLNGLKRPE